MKKVVSSILFSPVLLSSYVIAADISGSKSPVSLNTNENSGIIISSGQERKTTQTPLEHFTGRVFLDPLFLNLASPQRLSGSMVTFEPGARTDWHTHPVGQTLYITSGNGWVQEWGKAKISVKAGDVVNFLPGVKHWHGATMDSMMSHIAVQEKNDQGQNVDWLEKVTELQYTQKLSQGEK